MPTLPAKADMPPNCNSRNYNGMGFVATMLLSSTDFFYRVRLTSVLLACLLGAASGAAVAARWALYIGNDEYRHAPRLANAANDAKLIRQSLLKLDFAGEVLLNATRVDMLRELARINTKLQKGDLLFIYYAGHAVQFGGENYLIPVDAALVEPEDLKARAVSFTQLFAALGQNGEVTNLVVLDACRDNPFETVFAQAQARSLAAQHDSKGGREKSRYDTNGLIQPAEIPGNTLLAFATAPGKVAMDGNGANSPFAEALSKELLEEGLEITSVFRNTSLAVKEATEFQQEPWVNWSLNGRVVLRPRRTNMVAPW